MSNVIIRRGGRFALAAGLISVASLMTAVPASAALSSTEQTTSLSLASACEADVQRIVAEDRDKRPQEVTSDLRAAIEASILASGATPDTAREGVSRCAATVSRISSEWGRNGVPRAFALLADDLRNGALTGAGNGNGGNRSNGNGNSAFGTGGGNGGGGGSGYRGS